MKDFLIGNRPLWQAFWLLFVFGYFILHFMLLLILPKIYTPDREDILDLLVGATMIGYIVFSMISIWNCSKNTEKPVWYLLARLIVIWVAIVQVYTLFGRIVGIS